MNNFRLSNKKVYKDSRSSIENLHDEKMRSILEKEENIDLKKNKVNFLRNKLKAIQYADNNNNKSNNIFEIQTEIDILQNEIYQINNNYELIDYIDKAWEFLHDFKEHDFNINTVQNTDNNTINDSAEQGAEQGTEQSTEQSTERGIEQSTEQSTERGTDNCSEKNNDEANTNILNFINKTGKTNKGEEYKKYYDKCILNIRVPDSCNSSNNYCKNCKDDNFEIDSSNGIIICTNCGNCEPYIEYTSANINYNDSTQIETISQPFSYQRKNHFKEWLNQLQGKEVTVIPDTVITLILMEIKKERIVDSDEITAERIKKYLKKLKLNKYYEHIPNLISKLTNKPPLIITLEFEKVLLDLFDKIQEPFKKHCPKERKNFLSYSYTLHKFCQLLGKNEYLIYFSLLKSREKLFEQEKIWKGICGDLNWKFSSSI